MNSYDAMFNFKCGTAFNAIIVCSLVRWYPLHSLPMKKKGVYRRPCRAKNAIITSQDTGYNFLIDSLSGPKKHKAILCTFHYVDNMAKLFRILFIIIHLKGVCCSISVCSCIPIGIPGLLN